MRKPSTSTIKETAPLFWELDIKLSTDGESVRQIWDHQRPEGCLGIADAGLDGWADLAAFIIYHRTQLVENPKSFTELGYLNSYDARVDFYGKFFRDVSEGSFSSASGGLSILAQIVGRISFDVHRDDAHGALDIYRDSEMKRSDAMTNQPKNRGDDMAKSAPKARCSKPAPAPRNPIKSDDLTEQKPQGRPRESAKPRRHYHFQLEESVADLFDKYIEEHRRHTGGRKHGSAKTFLIDLIKSYNPDLDCLAVGVDEHGNTVYYMDRE